jgi:hypothetical protein
VKPGQDFEFLRCIGRYIVAKKPDVVLHLGDFCDFESLSSYDKGTRSFEGRRYKADILAAHAAMDALLDPLNDYNDMRRRNKKAEYRPRMVMTLGNHEERVLRTINHEPMLDGAIGLEDLRYAEYGWEVHDFLKVVVIENIAFSHYFATGAMGRPAASAQAQLSKKMMSCISGHQQGRQIASAYRADGRRVTSIIAGSCYEEDQAYLGPQINRGCWHGVIMLHNVNDGEFDEVMVPLHYLKTKYA